MRPISFDVSVGEVHHCRSVSSLCLTLQFSQQAFFSRDIGWAARRRRCIQGSCTRSDGLPLHAQGLEQCPQPAGIVGREIYPLKGAELKRNPAIAIENRDDGLVSSRAKVTSSLTFVDSTEAGDRITNRR